MNLNETQTEIGQPTIEEDVGKLPSAVTFFMASTHRLAVLNALKKHSENRTQAILIALGILDSKST